MVVEPVSYSPACRRNIADTSKAQREPGARGEDIYCLGLVATEEGPVTRRVYSNVIPVQRTGLPGRVCISICRVVGYGYASNMPLVDLQPTNALLGVWVFHRPPESSTNCVAALGRTLRLGARALVLAHQDKQV